jgi:RND superfamily putative drug exporter
MSKPNSRSLPARLIRTFALPIILGWLGLLVVLSTMVPQLEEVGRAQAVSMSPDAAPSMISVTLLG